MTIHLTNLSFYSYHGWYPEERQTGGEYLVDAEIFMDPPKQTLQMIEQTVNYVEAYEIIRYRMAQPTTLLENIVMDIADNLLALSPIINRVNVTVKKLVIPVPGFKGETAVSLNKKRL